MKLNEAVSIRLDELLTERNMTQYQLYTRRCEAPQKILCKRNSNQPTPTMACAPGIVVLSPSYLVSLVMRAAGVNDAAGFRES